MSDDILIEAQVFFILDMLIEEALSLYIFPYKNYVFFNYHRSWLMQ